MISRCLTPQILPTLLVAAFLASTLIPKGFMPGISAEGMPGWVICSSHPLSAVGSVDGGVASDSACDFEVMQITAACGDVSLAVYPTSWRALEIALESASTSNTAHPLPRGPPHSV